MATVHMLPTAESPPPALGHDVHETIVRLLRVRLSPLAGDGLRLAEGGRAWTVPASLGYPARLNFSWTSKVGRGSTHHYLSLTRDEAQALARELILWAQATRPTSEE